MVTPHSAMDSRLASTDRGLMVRTWRVDTREEEEGGGEGHLAVVQLELLPGGEAGGQAGDGDPVRVQHLHALAAPRPLPAWRLEVSHLPSTSTLLTHWFHWLSYNPANQRGDIASVSSDVM